MIRPELDRAGIAVLASLSADWGRTHILGAAVAALACTSPLQAADRTSPARPRVQTSQGTVLGLHLKDGDVFRGIPFAQPPTGDLRWRPPAPPSRWAGERDASSFGDICMQASRSDPELESRTQSEDCLTLNVIRPRGVTRAPVMVWLHGGANKTGAGSQTWYNVESFARRGIILVTVNYRLGNFGFFAHPAITADTHTSPATNFGLLDQVAALRWVQANIAVFGGDRKRVTVFGESAGGSDILALMTLPDAKSLFSAAIVESGGGTTLASLADAEADGFKAASDLGLGPSATAAQLRAVPADKLVKVGAIASPKPGYGPVVDGRLLKESPLIAFRTRGLPVPLIIGTNSDEGILATFYGLPPQDVITSFGGDGPELRAAYAGLAANPKDFARTLYRDVKFAAPARSVASLSTSRVPIWLYRFDYVPDAQRSTTKGVSHGGELQYIFDIGPVSDVATTTAADRRTVLGIQSCWAAFAITHNPMSAAFCREWRPFDKVRETFVVDDRPSMRTVDKKRLDAIDLLSSPTPRQ